MGLFYVYWNSEFYFVTTEEQPPKFGRPEAICLTDAEATWYARKLNMGVIA